MVSALGGQGCTLSAAYVGTALAESGRTVTMLDMCGFGGTLTHALGVAESAAMNAGDVLRGECDCEEALISCEMPTLSVLPPISFAEVEYVYPFSAKWLELAEQLSLESDIIADLPSGIVPNDAAVSWFDMFIICSRANRFALNRAASLRRIIENLCAECGASCETRLLLTLFSAEEMHGGGVTDIDECIDVSGARLLGVVPYDRDAAKAALEGAPPAVLSDAMRYSRDTACRLMALFPMRN